MGELKPLFEADRLTTRAFLFSLTLEQLSKVDVMTVACHPSEFVHALGDKLMDIPKGTTPPNTAVWCYSHGMAD